MANTTKKQRNGAAVVELAIVLPVLMLLVWGTIECSQALFTKQTLTSIAHEGVLSGMRLNSTEADIHDRIQKILDARSIDNCIVTISPTAAAFETLQSGDQFTVSITNFQSNSFINVNSVSVAVTSIKQ